MNLNAMKYKNYVWTYNPSTINVSVVRDLKEISIPFKGSIIQDFGREKRVVSGQGQFFGEDCFNQYDALFEVFKQGGSGYLSLPGMDSFLAVFRELEVTGDVMPNVINYSFEFWEDVSSETNEAYSQEEYYTVLEGDTLWSISMKYNVAVETLLQLNANIKNPNQLNAGERVKLK